MTLYFNLRSDGIILTQRGIAGYVAPTISRLLGGTATVRDNGFRISGPPAALRVYDHVPLPVSAVDHGVGAAHRSPKNDALRTGNQHYARAARFWAKIFAIKFTFGVVTGIPMEFQFGTN